MGWFSKKSDIPNTDLYDKLHKDGLAEFYAGNLKRSIELLIQASASVEDRLTTKSAEGMLYIGLAEMQLHDSDQNPQRLIDAEGALLMARSLDHNNLHIIYNQGTCYMKLKKFAEAEKCYLDFIGFTVNADALLKLGMICHKTGRRVEAVAYWERVLKVDPANASAKQNLENSRKYG